MTAHLNTAAPQTRGRDWRLFIPKSVTVIAQEGYSWTKLRADALAGLTVAIVAVPLAMAIAIASGVTPAQGLITAVVAGFLISALGGARFQIGGPTGAFIVVVYGVVHQYGYDGLAVATMMAGAILIAAGLMRVGDWIKYIPEPVVTGFTAGIAVIIFTSQLRDLFGLSMTEVPAEFVEKVGAFWAARESVSLIAFALAASVVAIILLLQRYLPRWPSLLIGVASGTALVWVFNLPVETIGSRFGAEAATALPSFQIPEFSFARMQQLLPSAFTIAFLAGVESLLSAMVADGMTGRRHRSNCEIVAQGVANVAAPLFGGISATGAIARTATNIRAGAQTPFAGIFHAAFVLIIMLGLGPLIAHVPLASLAAVLTIVAWNMSEQERFRHLLFGLAGDRVVLLATFLLTVLVDLTIAIEVGVVLAAIIFMHRMSEATAISRGVSLVERDQDDFANPRTGYEARAELPRGVEVFELRGPLFFGAASRLIDALDAAFPPPRAFILRFREVPLADASGVNALQRFLKRCASHNVAAIFCELRPSVHASLDTLHVLDQVRVTESYDQAIAIATHAIDKDQNSEL
ncbi:SulP family inorganic anion transporter [Vitreimonas flagellata]|uniref:SulP family inorganic anion transporter n=1 Tax=Vitreimonas flagellata TaxID=2560861 RepID=UPI0010753F25|nr:SulP family inorganic anion transporter [Vitreimonas flagellata]